MGRGLWALGVLAIAGKAACAQSSGVVLQLPASARAAALGNAYAAAEHDDASVFYNPAQLAGDAERTLSAGVSVQRYVEASHVAALSLAKRVGPGRLGIGMQLLDFGSEAEVVPDVEFGGERGRETGASVGARDFVASLGYGLQVAPVRIGATVKLVNQQIADFSGSTGAIDVGVAVATPVGVLAAVMQNSGGLLRVGSTVGRLPLAYRAGMALGALSLGRMKLVSLVELSKVRDTKVGWAGGGELTVPASREMLLVGRGGIRARRAAGGGSRLTLGGGVAGARLAVDYAYQTVEGLELGTHRVGVRWWR